MLTTANLVLTFALLPLLLLDFGAVAEPLLTAAEVAVFSATELLLAQYLNFYERKVFIGFEESLEKLLLIFFFWSLIKHADSRRSLKLVYFNARSGAEIDGFK